MKNPARFAVVGSIGNIFVFLGKLIILSGVVLWAYFSCTEISSLVDDLYSPWVIVIVCTILGYFVAVVFMSVYSMGIDTIL
jgi:hypothetical protein